MKTIELDAANWKILDDFYNALFAALGAPEWHGKNLNALLDTMIWHDDMNAVKPPYTIRIYNVHNLSRDIRDEIELLVKTIPQACTEFRVRHGRDIDVRVEIVSVN